MPHRRNVSPVVEEMIAAPRDDDRHIDHDEDPPVVLDIAELWAAADDAGPVTRRATLTGVLRWIAQMEGSSGRDEYVRRSDLTEDLRAMLSLYLFDRRSR